MSNQTTQEYVTPNPVLIDRIEASKTKAGSPQISLFSGALEYPVLNLAPFNYGLLFNVGIDPNTIQPGQPHYCQFLAVWEEGDKTNGNGRPYKNVTQLQPMPSATEQQAARQLESIKLLLTYLAEQQPGGREALVDWYKSREK